MNADKEAAYQTLYTVINELNLSMAPFTPFLAEALHQEMKVFSSEQPESVHLCSYPVADEKLIQPELEQAVTRMQNIILLGRQKRNNEKIRTKYPLSSLTVIHKDTEMLEEIARLEDYIETELNVKKVEYSTDESQFINLFAKPNSPVLGKRLGKQFKAYKSAIESLTSEAIEALQDSGSIALDGETFSVDDILIFREAMEGTNAVSNRFISIDMDCTLNEQLLSEGLAREVVNRIQKSRREEGFNVVDRIQLTIHASEALLKAIQDNREYVMSETLTTDLIESDVAQSLSFEIDEHRLSLSIGKAV